MNKTEEERTQEVIIAKDAFRFLLEDYVERIVPDAPVGAYLQSMIRKSMGSPPPAPSVKVEVVPPPQIQASAAVSPLPAQMAAVNGNPVNEASTREHIRQCLQNNGVIDLDTIASSTGRNLRQVQALIADIAAELRRTSGKSVVDIPGDTRNAPAKKTRKPVSEEGRANMRRGAQARAANRSHLRQSASSAD